MQFGPLMFLIAFVVIFVIAFIFTEVQRRKSAKPVAILVITDTGQMRMATTRETLSKDFSALLENGFYTDDGTFHAQHLIRAAHVVFAGEPIPTAPTIRTQTPFVHNFKHYFVGAGDVLFSVCRACSVVAAVSNDIDSLVTLQTQHDCRAEKRRRRYPAIPC